MGITPNYEDLPFSWKGKLNERIENDQRWLESIIRNAAPFSDAWTKARIVQLAYESNQPAEQEIYAGLTSETAIAQKLRSTCNLELYPGFAANVDEEYVIKTLNRWHCKRFAPSVARNFEVYADWQHDNTFLVTSTAPVSLEVDRVLPCKKRFRALFNVDELAGIMRERACNYVSLRTHGYANPAKGFHQSFAKEAQALNCVTATPQNNQQSAISNQHFYIGYQWPSEQPIVAPELWFDSRRHMAITLKFFLVLAAFAGVIGTLLYGAIKLLWIPFLNLLLNTFGSVVIWTWAKNNLVLAQEVMLIGMIAVVFFLWALIFQLLRIVVYQRDRNRAIHYGAPDLAEFFWRLDKSLDNPSSWIKKATQTNAQRKDYTLSVNLIGHSMGGLVLVQALRILSDKFGKDDQGMIVPDFMPLATGIGENLMQGTDTGDRIGEYLKLDKLILASPDIPLEFLREGRNNYVRSAIARCRQIYLMSSDRDIVLRYLSTLGNWFTEPSISMSGLRLGNVYLRQSNSTTPAQYTAVIRNLLKYRSVATATSAYDLFEKFNYLDCSEMKAVNGIKLPLNPINGVFVDLVNTALHFLKRIDVHGGYFWTDTPTFEILKFLMKATDETSDEAIREEIERLIAGTPIRFLPSQPFLSAR